MIRQPGEPEFDLGGEVTAVRERLDEHFKQIALELAALNYLQDCVEISPEIYDDAAENALEEMSETLSVGITHAGEGLKRLFETMGIEITINGNLNNAELTSGVEAMPTLESVNGTHQTTETIRGEPAAEHESPRTQTKAPSQAVSEETQAEKSKANTAETIDFGERIYPPKKLSELDADPRSVEHIVAVSEDGKEITFVAGPHAGTSLDGLKTPVIRAVNAHIQLAGKDWFIKGELEPYVGHNLSTHRSFIKDYFKTRLGDSFDLLTDNGRATTQRRYRSNPHIVFIDESLIEDIETERPPKKA